MATLVNLRLISPDTEQKARVTRRVERRLTSMLVGVLTVQIGLHHTVALAAYPPAAGQSQAPQHLRVIVDPNIEDASLISGWVVSRHPDLDDALSDPNGVEQWIAVEITGATYDYRVLVVAMREGEAVGITEARSCECTNEDLLVLVDGEIDAAIDRLRSVPMETPLDAEHEPRQVAPVVGASPRPTTGRGLADRALRWPEYTGICAGVVGLGLMASGIPLVLRPDQIRVEDDEVQTRSTRGAGVGLVMIGATTLVVGASLLIFEVVQVRKRPSHERARIARRSGLLLTWRF